MVLRSCIYLRGVCGCDGRATAFSSATADPPPYALTQLRLEPGDLVLTPAATLYTFRARKADGERSVLCAEYILHGLRPSNLSDAEPEHGPPGWIERLSPTQ